MSSRDGNVSLLSGKRSLWTKLKYASCLSNKPVIKTNKLVPIVQVKCYCRQLLKKKTEVSTFIMYQKIVLICLVFLSHGVKLSESHLRAIRVDSETHIDLPTLSSPGDMFDLDECNCNCDCDETNNSCSCECQCENGEDSTLASIEKAKEMERRLAEERQFQEDELTRERRDLFIRSLRDNSMPGGMMGGKGGGGGMMGGKGGGGGMMGGKGGGGGMMGGKGGGGGMMGGKGGGGGMMGGKGGGGGMMGGKGGGGGMMGGKGGMMGGSGKGSGSGKGGMMGGSGKGSGSGKGGMMGGKGGMMMGGMMGGKGKGGMMMGGMMGGKGKGKGKGGRLLQAPESVLQTPESVL